MSSRKLVYIAHPLGAGHDRENAARWVAWAARQGVAPIADWIILSGQLDETPENRELGLDCDKAAIRRCNELWLVGGRVSPGMQIEADYARSGGLVVKDFTWFGYDAPDAKPLPDGDLVEAMRRVRVELDAKGLKLDVKRALAELRDDDEEPPPVPVPVPVPPAIPHAYVPHPWGHDACDGKVDDNGRVRTCARPRREHAVFAGTEDQKRHPTVPCACGAFQLPVPTAQPVTVKGPAVEHRQERCGPPEPAGVLRVGADRG